MSAEDEVRQLQQEIGFLRSRVAEREEALARLTSRLLQLERGEVNDEAERRAADAEQRAGAALAELQALRATKTFRWTAAARAAWGRTLTGRSYPSGRRPRR